MHCILVLSLVLALSVSAHAQGGFGDYFPVDPASLIQCWLGTNVSYTATAWLTGTGKDEADNFSTDIELSVLQGRVRSDIDLARMQGPKPCTDDQLRILDSGLERIAFISLPEIRVNYIIYPHVKAYCETPENWRERDKRIADIEKTALGEESIAGQSCVKYRVLATNQIGQQLPITVWAAAGKLNFPVQLQFETPTVVFTMRFSNVKLTPPNLALFQPPVDCVRFENMIEINRTYLRRPLSAE